MATSSRRQSQTTVNIIDWEPTAIQGPALAFHAGCVVGNKFFIHGGVEVKDGKTPSSRLFFLNSASSVWQEVTHPGSPALSHHKAVALQGRYLLLIGGWNGKSRSSKLYIFDTEKELWLVPRVIGFPEDGGLSSHTATLLDSGEILILGREGSLRMQRRHGSGYLLSGNVVSGEFCYREYTQATASRSGHTANIIGNVLYIIGGRDNNLVEMHQGFKSGTSSSTITNPLSDAMTKLPPLTKEPGGRKNHITVEGQSALLVHGGETFDGRSREPVGDMFIFTRKPTPTFFKVGVSDVKRAGHVCGIVGDKIFLHGGFSGRGTVNGDTFILNFKKN